MDSVTKSIVSVESEDAADAFENIPAELRSAPWVNWRVVPKKDKPGEFTKYPYHPRGDLASVSDPKTWSTFDAVVESVARFDGIGIVNRPDSPRTVLDVDDAIEDGKLKSSALELLERFETYTEISPSGLGLRIILSGRIKSSGTDTIEFSDGAKVEIFHGAHYFTMTGAVYEGRRTIEDCTEQLKTFLLQNGRETAEENNGTSNVARTKIPMTRAIDIARRYYDFDNYNDWIEIGQILKSSYENDERSFEAWTEWSSVSMKYPGEEVSRKKWKSFRRNEKTVGSLVHKEQEMKGRNVLRVLPGGLRILAGGNLDERTHPAQTELSKTIEVLDASDWLDEPDEHIETILPGLLAVGDKLLICGKSKTKKTFLAAQLVVCLAAGKNFLHYAVNRKWRVLIIQMEIRSGWFKRRLRRIAGQLGIPHHELQGYLKVINGRGKEITVEKILEIARAQRHRPEVIILDPVYKLDDLEEKDTEAWKKLLRGLDRLAEELSATPGYVHHDRKGLIAEDIGDRGSGSGIIGRDWDSFVGLAEHATDKKLTVLEVGSRNFPPDDDARSIEFKDGAFIRSETAPVVVKTGNVSNPTSELSLESFLEPAVGILSGEPLAPEVLKDRLKRELGLTDDRTRALFALLKSDERVACLPGARKKRETDLWGSKEDIERIAAERAVKE